MKRFYCFLVLCVVSNFFSQILFDKVSKSIQNIDISPANIVNILTIMIINPLFWLSIIIYILSAILWLLGIKKIPLSNAYSITSLNYIFVTFYAIIFLNEVVSFQKLISICLVISGVFLMSVNTKMNITIKKI